MPHTLLALLFVLVAMSDVVTCEPHQNKMADRSSIFEIIRSNIGSLGTVEMHNAARGKFLDNENMVITILICGLSHRREGGDSH